ncbi:hypothetical protein JCM19233_5397 [Vibrio astriarenae]|nr:hypothetical protein JCM19233_5397 [Vibrio sp. C7]
MICGELIVLIYQDSEIHKCILTNLLSSVVNDWMKPLVIQHYK